MNFLHARIPAGLVLIAVAVSSAATALVVKSHVRVIERVTAHSSCDLRILRNQEYKLTKPLVMVDVPNESPDFASMKGDLMSFIDDQKQKGVLSTASVYFRDFNTGRWFTINGDEKYSPGSLMKVFTLQCILKQAEKDPGFLKRKLLLKQHLTAGLEQTLVSAPLKPGQTYEVQKLLESMIINSDNDATALLNSQISKSTFEEIFRLLDLSAPSMTDWNYSCSATEVSRFMRSLYNSAFLRPDYSELGLELLSRTNFKTGITQELPPNLIVAHKFGERFGNDFQELHETAILYLDQGPVLLTVMTRGKDRTALPSVLSQIGSRTYRSLTSGLPSASL